ncbi:MAG: aldehyde dehydrogenase family protein [Deltaproteobacteria bacterium]|nr:aldehyde dehydrogenase family protein [Deltaproteobacteria bacterium]
MSREKAITLAKELQNFWSEEACSVSTCNAWLEVTDPYTLETVANLRLISPDGLSEAIDKLRCGEFGSTPLLKKLEIFANLLDIHKDDIAGIITLESGKPINESLKEIELSQRYLKSYLSSLESLSPSTMTLEEAVCRVVNEPVGKAALIVPWNFPFLMLARKVIPALIAGCGVILKPAPETPLSAIFFCKLLREAGVDTDLFFVAISNETEFGDVVCERFDIRKISFTGSTEVGKLLFQKSAKTLKRLTLELGGNAPFLVLENANPETFCQWLRYSKFRNCGQACTAVNRVLVHERHYQFLVDQYVQLARNLKQGDGFSPETDIGPLINDFAVEKIRSIVEDAVSKGAKCYPEQPTFTRNLKPTVLWDLPLTARAFHEEIFGPVVAIWRGQSDDELLSMANDTNYGLSAYIFGGKEAMDYAKQLDFEMIGVNTGFVSYPEFPFGGRKLSGFGKEGGGLVAIEGYSNKKILVEKI